MYSDDNLVMISALQHFVFCERQCALIHLEQVWAENRLTAEGRLLHDRVDQAKTESRKDCRTATAIHIRSSRLGLVGIMDMLEFHRVGGPQNALNETIAARLPHASDWWVPFPVEYKRGKPKEHRADEIQLCAQALCLEEMLSVSILQGALFYGQTRRRVDVFFDLVLRQLTESTAQNVHALIESGKTPPPSFSAKCKSCSLLEICQPTLYDHRSAKRWLVNMMETVLQ